MKLIHLFFCFVFLFGCSSSEKHPYNIVIEEDVFEKNKNSSSREITYLKNLSSFEEGNFQFITKQMKEVIKNYGRMKQQLAKVEIKLDRFLARQILKKHNQKKHEIMMEKRKQANESEEEQKQRDEETVIDEEPVPLQEEMTDDTNIFQDGEMTDDTNIFQDEEMTDDTNIFQDEEMTDDTEETENKAPLKENLPKEAKNKKSNKQEPSSLMEAKNLFEKESYENAISKFQKYRDKNPEGKHYPEATFYIGQSFKKLQMPVEAEIFFKEVVQSYPQSLWASRARKSLKE